MAPAILKVPGRSLGEWLREISHERRTGKLQIDLEGVSRELFFLAGDLYLGPDHPAYEAAQAWLEETRPVAEETENGSAEVPQTRNEAAAPLFRQLAGPIISVSGGAEELECSFVSGAGQIRIDLAGPLPTRQLVMECAVWQADEPGLWRRLGGDQVELRACAGLDEAMIGVHLEPQEAFLLSRLDQPAKAGELMNQLDQGTEQVLRSLCRLHAVGLVERVDDDSPATESVEPKEKLVSRFEKSIGESLDSEPLEIEADSHRELLGNLLSRMGEMTYFEMLAVSAQSSDEDIHKAYLELGRLVHPRHAASLGLSGKEGAFRVLFERATDAYLTLNDPTRKLEYIRDIGPSSQGLVNGPSGETRDQEKQSMARTLYERSLALAERQDYHSAIQLLEQAVGADPQIDYLTLLGDCQAENPQWLDRAAQSYQQALQVRPNDPSLSTRLGRVHERRGARQAARRAYESALAVEPEMEDARAGLWRLGGGKTAQERPSLVDRLRKLLRT